VSGGVDRRGNRMVYYLKFVWVRCVYLHTSLYVGERQVAIVRAGGVKYWDNTRGSM